MCRTLHLSYECLCIKTTLFTPCPLYRSTTPCPDLQTSKVIIEQQCFKHALLAKLEEVELRIEEIWDEEVDPILHRLTEAEDAEDHEGQQLCEEEFHDWMMELDELEKLEKGIRKLGRRLRRMRRTARERARRRAGRAGRT